MGRRKTVPSWYYHVSGLEYQRHYQTNQHRIISERDRTLLRKNKERFSLIH